MSDRAERITLPEGGLPLSMGVALVTDRQTGSATVRVPIVTPPGRAGFGPALALTWSAETPNGPFGLGWSLGLPSLERRRGRVVVVGESVARARLRAFADGWELRRPDGRTDLFGVSSGGRVGGKLWRLEASLDAFGNRIEYAWSRGLLVEVRWVDVGARFLYAVELRYGARPDVMWDRVIGRVDERCTRIRVRGPAGVIRSYQLEYLPPPHNGVSLLGRVRVAGHDGAALPPVELDYTKFRFEQRSFEPVASKIPERPRAAAARVARPADFPKIALDDPRVQRADLTGSGRRDLVIARDGVVDYWPALEGGRFGARVRMAGAPRLPGYDPARVLFGDVDGDGVDDLVYVTDRDVRVCINQGGRSFFAPAVVPGMPALGPDDRVELVDLHGGGAAGLLYRRRGARQPLLYLQIGGQEPANLLCTIEHGQGVTSRLSYIHSRSVGSAQSHWLVQRESETDSISGKTKSIEYRYSHPLPGGAFGRVDALDGTLETRTWYAPGDDYWAADQQMWAALPGSVADARRPLRVEIYAAGATRPHRVQEWAYASAGEHIYEHAARTSEWAGGAEPRRRLWWFDEPDAHGRPQRALDVALARSDEAPPLATLTRTRWAGRDDDRVYLIDRVARTTRWDVVAPAARSVDDLLRALADDSADLRIVADTVHHYDGAALHGLAVGAIGGHGALVRSETLVLTDDLARVAWDEPPAYLGGDTVEDYPDAWRNALARHAGHQRRGDDDHHPGWWATVERRRWDFQEAGRPHGLVTLVRDALDRDTTLHYDAHRLHPTRVAAGGLTTHVQWDLRLGVPALVTGPNHHRTAYEHDALGRLCRVAPLAPNDVPEGPSRTYQHDAFAFVRERRPVSVRHGGAVTQVDYFDGWGRLIQTRAAALGRAYPALPADPEVEPGAAAPEMVPDQVVVSAREYDQNGRILSEIEPHFARGFAWAAATGPRQIHHYDAVGREYRTIFADQSERLTLHGTPAAVAAPGGDVEHGAWERFTYGPSDNAGRTHAGRDVAAHLVDTPVCERLDALGRAVEQTHFDATGAVWTTTTRQLDSDGRTVAAVDGQGRTAHTTTYDFCGRPLRRTLLGAGTQRTIRDAAGQPIEERGPTGAWVLRSFDALGRLVRLWARDALGEPLTLRERHVYGDAIDSGLSVGRAVEAQLLGRLYRRFDEAGLTTVRSYDRGGRPVETVRQVLALRPPDAAPDDPVPGLGGLKPYHVDWQPPGSTSLDTHARQLLDETTYTTSHAYDAAGRLVHLVYPPDAGGRRALLRHHYDGLGRLTRLELDGTAWLAELAYDAAGRVVLAARGNGMVTRVAYDGAGRMVRLYTARHEKKGDGWTPVEAPLQDQHAVRDLDGHLAVTSERAPGNGTPTRKWQDRSYYLDLEGKLRTSEGREAVRRLPDWPWDDEPQPFADERLRIYEETYQWRGDALLRVSHNAIKAVYDHEMVLAEAHDGLERLRAPDGFLSYHSDEAGRAVSEASVRHFQWDHAGRLRAFVWQSGEEPASLFAHYRFDAAGRRVQRVIERAERAPETWVQLDGYEHHRHDGGDTRLLYVRAGERVLGRIRSGAVRSEGSGETAPEQLHLYADLEGSCVLATDENGALVAREEFTPLGETRLGGLTAQPLRFRFQARDAESGLYASLHRDGRPYASYLGRALAPAPIPLDPPAAPADAHTAPAVPSARLEDRLSDDRQNQGADNGERQLPHPGPRHRPEPQAGSGTAHRSLG